MTASTKERPSTAAEEAPAKGGKKKLIIILLVVLLAAGGAAYFFLFSGSGKPAPPEPGLVLKLDPVAVNLAGGGYLKVGVALQLTADVAEAEEPVAGAVVVLDPVAVNLAGGGYLKVGVALQLTADVGEEAPDGSKATDLVISTFSQAKPADVTGARDALKAALQKKIIDAYTEDGVEQVMGIYYTEYVTQ